MKLVTVHEWTVDTARAERDRLLAQVGLTAEQLSRLAEHDALNEAEYRVWRRIKATGAFSRPS